MSDWTKNTAWIGKLPGHGDFLTHQLEHTLKLIFDSWLSELMHDINQTEAGLRTYYSAPAVHLAIHLQNGVRLQGFLMPSVDKPGRPFPWLALHWPGNEPCPHWAEAIETASRRALDLNWSAHELKQALQQTKHPTQPIASSLIHAHFPAAGLMHVFKGNGSLVLPSPPEPPDWQRLFHD